MRRSGLELRCKTKRVGKTCAECITRARWNVTPALPAAKTSGRTRRRQADDAPTEKPKSSSSKLPCRRGCGRSFKNAGARTKHEAACAHGRDTEEAEDANDDLIGQKVINVFPGAGGFRMGFVRERVPPPAGSVRIGNYMRVICVERHRADAVTGTSRRWLGRPKFDFHIGASGTIIPSRSTKLQKYAINCSGSGRGPKFPRPRSTRPSARCTKST